MDRDWIEAHWPAPTGIVAGTTLRDSRFELPAEPRWIRQVHGKHVVHWDSVTPMDSPPEADAIVADRPGSICVVKTADCLPILLCASDGSEIAAVHAGWRGLAAGVIDATLEAMRTTPGQLLAWIGPAISRAAFEVGHEVREAFAALGDVGSFFEPNDNGRLQADLPGIARHVLQRQRVAVFDSGLCTHGDPGRFYSYRRDGETGRHLSFIYLGSDPDR